MNIRKVKPQNNTVTDDRPLTIQEAAEWLGVPVSEVERLSNAGEIAYCTLGDFGRRYKKCDLIHYIESTKRKARDIERSSDMLLADRTTPPISKDMTIKECADYLNVSIESLRYKVSRRLIPYHKYGHRELRFNRDEIDSYRRKTLIPAIE